MVDPRNGNVRGDWNVACIHGFWPRVARMGDEDLKGLTSRNRIASGGLQGLPSFDSTGDL